MVGRQPNAPAAFTPGEIPGTTLPEIESTSGHMVLSGEPRKTSPVTPPGIDPGTVRLVAQCLNHYATPGPLISASSWFYCKEICYDARSHVTMHGHMNVKLMITYSLRVKRPRHSFVILIRHIRF